MKTYIEFETFDRFAGIQPVKGVAWNRLTPERKRQLYEYINYAIESHQWDGHQLGGTEQVAAFPRVFPLRNGCKPVLSILRWDTDPERISNESALANFWDNWLFPDWFSPWSIEVVEEIFFSTWLAEAAAGLAEMEQQNDLQFLSRIGVKKTKVGPIETEFFAGGHGSTPLPEPLWSKLAHYSREYNPESDSSRSISIGRA